MIVILIFIAICMISVILSFVMVIGTELYDATEDIREEIANKIGEKEPTILYSIEKLITVGLVEKKKCITEEKNKKKTQKNNKNS